jgi:oligopeptide/dipeptide ABC transporter ATP-binding protein
MEPTSPPEIAGEPLFVVRNVDKVYGKARPGRRNNHVRALDNVSIDVRRGEALGLVGESGSGKTTLGRLLVGFESPTTGSVLFQGREVAKMRRAELGRFRNTVQMVFQNPFAALNPFRTVRDVLSSGYRRRMRKPELRTRLVETLGRVGLHESMLDRYPFQFSGGQRQRIVIARALTVQPSVLIADEPVSALDVSVQAQVLNLFNALQRDLGLTIVMVTHDLRVVNFFCDRIAVLYLGRLVEVGERDEVINRSWHPYTRMLMSAAPNGDPEVRSTRPWVSSELGTASPPEGGCIFAPRCWLREQLGNPERCLSDRPESRELPDEITASPGHVVECHFAEEVPHYARLAEEELAAPDGPVLPGTGSVK